MTNIQVPYVTFMKHAQKVARSASPGRPILKTVLHKDDYVAVTDSHRLYLATGLYSGEEKTLNAVTGQEEANGNYPEVKRLITDSTDAKHSHELLDVNLAYEAVRAIEIASRPTKTDSMVMEVNYYGITLRADETAAFGVEYKEGTNESKIGNDPDISYVQIKYLKEALHALKDAKVDKFSLHHFGSVRPFQIESGNFTALISPIRKDVR